MKLRREIRERGRQSFNNREKGGQAFSAAARRRVLNKRVKTGETIKLARDVGKKERLIVCEGWPGPGKGWKKSPIKKREKMPIFTPGGPEALVWTLARANPKHLKDEKNYGFLSV